MRTTILFVALVACSFSLASQTPAIPTPTQTDQVIPDNNGNGKADPGDKIRYKVTIQNTGTGNANGVQLQVNPDPRTTLDAGSFRSSPVAVNDGPYACTGNVGISVPAASGVKTNDFDDNLAGATLSVVTDPANGTVMLNNDGSFTYMPNAGYTGNDQFTYEITDVTPVAGHTPANADIRATVTITVSSMIWFVNNTGGGSGGTGTRPDPFKTLANFNAASGPAAGHVVHIQHTGTDYPGGLVLKDNMVVIGTGHTGGSTLADVLPFTLAANSPALPAINGPRPVITNSGGDGVALAQNNNLRGFNVGNCSDFGMDNIGTNSIGNLVVSEVDINNGTGGGFDASHGSGTSMNAVFGSISSNGGANGINLTNCAGTFTVNGGTITNPTGTGVLISGGSVVFSSSGAITNNTGLAVDIDNHDSGDVTFSGNITSTGTGIRVQSCNGGTKTFSGSSKSLNTAANTAVTLSSNTGATINFTNGGLAISTTSGTGFNAMGGGTVTVQGSGNTINSTSATALNMVSTTIGSSGMTFQSISSGNNTVAADPVNGIVLNSTGSTGFFTVTGDGSNTTQGGNGSGGTIQNVTGANESTIGNGAGTGLGTGVFLSDAHNVTLRRMTFTGSSNFGINAQNVTGLTLQYCKFNGTHGNSGADQEGCIRMLELRGTNLIDNCDVRTGFTNNIRLDNDSGTLAGLSITNNIIRDTNTGTNGNDNVQADFAGTATVTNLSINGNTFAATNGDHVDVTVANSVTISAVNIQNNTCSGGGSNALGQGLRIAGAVFSGSVGFNISNNVLNGTISGGAINVTLSGATGSTGTFNGTINNNAIGTAAIADSGCSGTCSGIIANNASSGTFIVAITNNSVRQYTSNGIQMSAGNTGVTTGGVYQATVTGNLVANPGTFALYGMDLNSGTVAGNAYQVCAHISGNTMTGSAGTGGAEIQLRQRQATTVRLPGYAGANNNNAAVQTFIAGQNTVTGAASVVASNSVPTGGGFVGGAACTSPSN